MGTFMSACGQFFMSADTQPKLQPAVAHSFAERARCLVQGLLGPINRHNPTTYGPGEIGQSATHPCFYDACLSYACVITPCVLIPCVLTLTMGRPASRTDPRPFRP